MVLVRKAPQTKTSVEAAKSVDFYELGQPLHALEKAQYAGMLRGYLP
jgi:hypothetical protein